MYRRIIVPLDGSELAEKALAHAEELAAALNTPLLLVRVVDVTRLERYGAYGLAIDYAGLAEVTNEEERAAREYLRTTAAALSAKGRTVTTEVGRGLVTPILVGLTQPGDLVVIASHGRTGVARWFLGSVAEDIARHADVPVLIVRTLGPDA